MSKKERENSSKKIYFYDFSSKPLFLPCHNSATNPSLSSPPWLIQVPLSPSSARSIVPHGESSACSTQEIAIRCQTKVGQDVDVAGGTACIPKLISSRASLWDCTCCHVSTCCIDINDDKLRPRSLRTRDPADSRWRLLFSSLSLFSFLLFLSFAPRCLRPSRTKTERYTITT